MYGQLLAFKLRVMKTDVEFRYKYLGRKVGIGHERLIYCCYLSDKRGRKRQCGCKKNRIPFPLQVGSHAGKNLTKRKTTLEDDK